MKKKVKTPELINKEQETAKNIKAKLEKGEAINFIERNILNIFNKRNKKK